MKTRVLYQLVFFCVYISAHNVLLFFKFEHIGLICNLQALKSNSNGVMQLDSKQTLLNLMILFEYVRKKKTLLLMMQTAGFT